MDVTPAGFELNLSDLPVRPIVATPRLARPPQPAFRNPSKLLVLHPYPGSRGMCLPDCELPDTADGGLLPTWLLPGINALFPA